MQIRIQKHVLNGIFKHGLKDFPDECCGFLFGVDEGERIAQYWSPVHNDKTGDKRRRFLIHPLDYIRAEQHALQTNTQLLGVYHSHPLHPAVASEHDLAQAMPFFSYVIISVFPKVVKEIRSWRLDEDNHQFFEETVNH